MARIDAGVRQGDEITPFYDPMIAKMVVHGSSREAALASLASALEASHALGVTTNIDFLGAVAVHPDFSNGDVDTGLIERDLAQLVTKRSAPVEATALAALEVLDLVQERRSYADAVYDPGLASLAGASGPTPTMSPFSRPMTSGSRSASVSNVTGAIASAVLTASLLSRI